MTEKIITIAGEAREISLEHDGSRFRAGEHEIELVAVRGNEAELRAGGKTHIVPFVVSGTDVWFSFDGEIYSADVADKGSRAKARHREQSTAAPMPGVVLKILVRTGDAVTKGKPLIILEAMKMEHRITAPHDGTVAAIHCSEGELVQPGTELVDINPS
jgi:3-methylcrotonyl-CoA carboxylase alpha subunit